MAGVLLLGWLEAVSVILYAASICQHYSRISPNLHANPSIAEATFVQITRMQRFLKASKPCHVGIHWMALAESALRYVPLCQGFIHLFFRLFASFRISTEKQFFPPCLKIYYRKN